MDRLLSDGGGLELDGLELDSDGGELDELDELEELDSLGDEELDELDSDGGGGGGLQSQQLTSNTGTNEAFAPRYVPGYRVPGCSVSHSRTMNSGSPDPDGPA